MKYLTIAATALALSAGTLQAATFQYDFDFGAFDAFDFDGQESTVRLTLDNGGTSNLNQTYNLNQIVSGQVLTIDSVAQNDFQEVSLSQATGLTAQTFITTDASGLATITTTGASNGFIFLGGFALDPLRLIQFAIPGSGGTCEYAITIGDTNGGRQDGGICSGSINGTTGSLAGTSVAPVPLPAGFPLLAAGLIGLGALARRKKPA